MGTVRMLNTAGVLNGFCRVPLAVPVLVVIAVSSRECTLNEADGVACSTGSTAGNH